MRRFILKNKKNEGRDEAPLLRQKTNCIHLYLFIFFIHFYYHCFFLLYLYFCHLTFNLTLLLICIQYVFSHLRDVNKYVFFLFCCLFISFFYLFIYLLIFLGLFVDIFFFLFPFDKILRFFFY